jgi:hypothetical protein
VLDHTFGTMDTLFSLSDKNRVEGEMGLRGMVVTGAKSFKIVVLTEIPYI